MGAASGEPLGYRAAMPGKVPQKPTTKKQGKSLKEKRAAKKEKRDKRGG